MTSIFPPQSVHAREIAFMLEILASVIEGRTAVYVSTPITTGKRFLKWYVQKKIDERVPLTEQKDMFLREVVEYNRQRARVVVRRLRHGSSKIVIDPTSIVDFPGWTQDDYRCLWGRVIERYVDRVIFIEGWQYSNGCAYEFLVAQQAGVTTLSESEEPLALQEGIRLIQAAIKQMRSVEEIAVDFLQRVVIELNKLNSSRQGR